MSTVEPIRKIEDLKKIEKKFYPKTKEIYCFLR